MAPPVSFLSHPSVLNPLQPGVLSGFLVTIRTERVCSLGQKGDNSQKPQQLKYINIFNKKTDRWGAHQDAALPGTPPDYKHTAIVYITEGGGALDFPTLNTSVPFTKGGVVAFPARLEHGVVSAGPRIMLGPFSDAM